jgi:hypothetical protein
MTGLTISIGGGVPPPPPQAVKKTTDDIIKNHLKILNIFYLHIPVIYSKKSI